MYTIFYNPEEHVLESRFQGDLTLTEVKAFISEAGSIAIEKDCTLFLTDYREATLKLSTLEIYEVPKIMQKTFSSSTNSVHLLRRAVVAAKDLGDYRFYETVTANAGQKARLFHDVDEAKKWLLGK